MELVMSSPGTRIISAPMIEESTESIHPRLATRYAGAAMKKEAAMVRKKGFTSSRFKNPLTRPMISPNRPAHRLSRRVPPKTKQKPKAPR